MKYLVPCVYVEKQDKYWKTPQKQPSLGAVHLADAD